MQVQELLAQACDVITIKPVFGEPIEKNGLTIIPVANVLGGVGGGVVVDRSRPRTASPGAGLECGRHPPASTLSKGRRSPGIQH